MNDQEILEHGIHLFLDGELDSKTQRHIQERINQNPAIAQAYKELKNCKDAIAFSYNNEPLPVHYQHHEVKQPMISLNIAASVALVMGLSIGWFASNMANQTLETNNNIAYQAPVPDSSNFIPANQEQQPSRKLMFYLKTNNPDKAKQTLEETRAILKSYEDSNIPVIVDIIIGHDAESIFKPEHAEHLNQLSKLVANFKNFHLFACNNTALSSHNIEPLSKISEEDSKNCNVQKIINKRVKEGWAYIQA